MTTILEMYEYKQSNREKTKAPRRRTKFWCDHCDAQLVNEWKKCPICGKRSGSKRLKKD